MGFEIDRNGFREAIDRALPECGDQGGPAVVLIKLASFHKVNTSYGYEVADEIIAASYAALEAILREPIRAYRVGGTRFGFIVPNVRYPGLIRIGIERALAAAQGPLELDGGAVSLAAVAGAAVFPDDGQSADQLLLGAELALQSARVEGAQIVLHNAADQQKSQDTWQLESDLHQAVDDGQMCVHYQPQMDLGNFTTAGFEALLRWHHPEQGRVSPETFIPLAERSKLINGMTEWVIQTALRQTAGLRLPGRPTKIAVNVSPVTLFDAGFPYAIESALSLWGGSHEQLVLEVTEGTLVRNMDVSKRVLASLRAKGVRIAIDDFGTGYSSLAYIKRLEIDEIKIDKSFITNIANNQVDQKLVESIIDVGHKLGLEVVAEGVENEQALSLLRDMGCDIAQGFLISHALDAVDMVKWCSETLHAGTA